MMIFKYQVGLLWVGSAFLSHFTTIKPHTHEYCHLLFSKKGRFKSGVGKEEFIMEPGKTLLALEDTGHWHEAFPDEEASFVEVKFVVYDPLFHAKLEQLAPVFTSDEFSEILIANMVRTANLPGEDMANACGAYFMSFLYHSLGILNAPPPQAKEKSISDQVLSYIDANYSRAISLKEIADALGYNKSYLCTIVKREKKIRINDYLNEARIRKACELVSFSDCDLDTVCQMTGFSNKQYFTRIFKKMVGIPPGHYRGIHAAAAMSGNFDALFGNQRQKDNFYTAIMANKVVSTEEAWRFAYKIPKKEPE